MLVEACLQKNITFTVSLFKLMDGNVFGGRLATIGEVSKGLNNFR